MTAIHQNFIAGEWTGANAVENINPSNTDEVVGLYAQGNASDVKQAVAAARAAFPAWSRSSILERHAILKKAGEEIIARKEELGSLLAREEGKTLPEAIGETVRAGQIFEFFAGESLRLARRGATVRAAQCHRRDHPGATWCRGHHNALEFSNCDSRLENCAGPLLWEYGRVQAGRARSGMRMGNRQYSGPSRASKGVLNLVMGKGGEVGQAMLDSPKSRGHQFHRFCADWKASCSRVNRA